METPHLSPMHAFQGHPMPMAPLSSYGPSVQHQPQQHSSDHPDRARAYKSRNKRPCDFCRYKKAACHLESQPPCELCIRYNKECTFVESPAKRRRPNEESKESSLGTANGLKDYDHERNGSGGRGTPFLNGGMHNSFDTQQDIMGWESGMPPYQMQSMGMSGSLGGPEFAIDPAFYQDSSMSFESTFEPMSASSTTMIPMDHKFPHAYHHGAAEIEVSPRSSSSQPANSLSLPYDLTSGQPSLDQQSSSNSLLVGLSGESDPYLFSRYRFDQNNEASFQSIRIRKMNDGPWTDSSMPTFFTIQHNALASKAQPPEKVEMLDRYRREVEEMVSDEVGKRLIRLFYKYVQPFYPILNREGDFPRDEEGIREPSSVSTCFLAAVYGHALPFCAWDEKLCVEVYTPPSADALFRIAWLAVLPLLHTPSLAALQTLLLLVQRRPTNKHVSDTPFKGVMMSAAVSIAQALGINRDPSNWPLPSWEIKLRKRLAWATFIQDKWLALNSGRSSLIQRDDWDVEMLVESDFAERDRNAEGPVGIPIGMTCQLFIRLCELTKLADEILRDLFSVKATKALQNSLEATLEVAKPLRLRLTEWYQALPAGLLPQPSPGSPDDNRRRSLQHELNGNGSLHLAYITAKIELFRAMLRPRVTDTNATAVSALRTGALAVAGEVFEFLEGLNARELEAFWASYSRTNFTIASSFMLLLYATSPNLADAKECLALLNAWRSLLRIKSRSCDLLNLALLRLDGVFVAGIDRLLELSPAAQQAWNESGQSKG